MVRRSLLAGILSAVICSSQVGAIANEESAYSQLNRDVDKLTAVVTRVNANTFSTPEQRHDFVRDSVEKDELADKISDILTRRILQERVRADDPDLAAKLASVHAMLLSLKQIQETVDTSQLATLKTELTKLRRLDRIVEPTSAVPGTAVAAEGEEAQLSADTAEAGEASSLARARARARAIARARARARTRLRARERVRAQLRTEQAAETSRSRKESVSESSRSSNNWIPGA